nr:DsrE family protein [uncultured Shewanella sp.]
MSARVKFGVIGVIGIVLIGFMLPVQAGMEVFKNGTAIKGYGKIAAVDSQLSIPQNTVFKVAFDMSKAANAGEVNRNLNTLARFINMHVAAGVKPENIQLAMVVHGASVADLANDEFYDQFYLAKQSKQGQQLNQTNKSTKTADTRALTVNEAKFANANKDLVSQLVNHGVKIYICGQSAAYYELNNTSLLPGVDMALSAMTAHAILAQQGYSLNPF